MSRPNRRSFPFDRTILAGICATLVFVSATSFHLKRTGMYYDELHQAVGAFAYVGRPTTMFTVMPVGGVPLLTMPYSGAIKTAAYGIYLRLVDRGFSILSWRLLGIFFSVAGIGVFCLLVGERIPISSLAILLGLLLTDANFLLQSRHDWGPVTLAFFLRMTFVGLWLRGVDSERIRTTSFLLGLIVGLSVFEKLSSAVLLGPLAIFLLTGSGASLLARLGYGGVGVGVGALPVIAANVVSFVRDSSLLALQGASPDRQGFLAYCRSYLGLGVGASERAFILADRSFAWSVWLEGIGLLVLLLLITSQLFFGRVGSERPRAIGIALACYASVGLLLKCLPAGTAENHWIIGTPFQYLALALGSQAIWTARAGTRAAGGILCAGFVALLVARAGPLYAVGEAFRDDHYSLEWDPSLNVAATYAAGLPGDAIFIAADWGVATQVFCFANGRQEFVYEPFWDYHGRKTLAQMLEWPGRKLLLVARLRKNSGVNPWATRRIFLDLAKYPGWAEVPLEPRIRDLRAVEMHAFRRQPATAAPDP